MTLASLPQIELAVSWPRRSSEASTTSSCSRVAVWLFLLLVVWLLCFGFCFLLVWVFSSTRIGRSRLPPLLILFCFFCLFWVFSVFCRVAFWCLSVCLSSAFWAFFCLF